MSVGGYKILIYGSEKGYQTYRAQIQLIDDGTVVAFIRFTDPGMPFEADTNSGGIITMHLPSAMFLSVLDILRNEKPLNIYFASGRGFFGTTTYEPVGEEETAP